MVGGANFDKYLAFLKPELPSPPPHFAITQRYPPHSPATLTMSDPPAPLRAITNIPKATKATPTATPSSSKKENIHPSVEKTTVAGNPDSEDAEVIALLRTKKHVPLPFHLTDEFGMIGCSDENGDKLLEYFRKAFPASTVTQAILTAPYIIVLCTKIPSGPLPFTVGGLPTIFATKDTPDLRYKLGTPARKRKHIVTSLNFHNKDKVTDEAIWTIAGELQQLHLHPTEIGFMHGACRLVFPNSADPTDIPYRIAGCPVYVQFQSIKIAKNSTPHPVNV